MGDDTQKLSLRAATLEAFREGGTKLLARPEEFLAIVMERGDQDLPGIRILERNCDRGLLGIYEAAEESQTPDAIGNAASRATYLLAHERLIQDDMAEQVASELAFALATFLRIDCPEFVREAAVRDVWGDDIPKEPREQADSELGTQETQSAQETDGEQERPIPTGHGNRGASDYGARSADGGGSSSQGDASGASSRTVPDVADSLPATPDPFVVVRLAPGASVSERVAAIDVRRLSLNPEERKRQIEAAGIGMDWFFWIKTLCWFMAFRNVAVMGSQINTLMRLSESELMTHHPGSVIVLFFEVGVAGMLVVAHLVAWHLLRRYKRTGPAIHIWAMAIDMVLPILLAYLLAWSLEDQADLLLTAMWALFVSGLLFVNRTYLSNRRGLFNL